MLSSRSTPSLPVCPISVQPPSPRQTFWPGLGAEVRPLVWPPRQTSMNLPPSGPPPFAPLVAQHYGYQQPTQPQCVPQVGQVVLKGSSSTNSLQFKWPDITGSPFATNAPSSPKMNSWIGSLTMSKSLTGDQPSKSTQAPCDADEEEKQLQLCLEQLEASAEENLKLRALLGSEDLGSLHAMEGLRSQLSAEGPIDPRDEAPPAQVPPPACEPPDSLFDPSEGTNTRLHRSLHWKRDRLAVLDARRATHEKWIARVEYYAQEMREAHNAICNEFEHLQNSIVSDTALYLTEVKKTIVIDQMSPKQSPDRKSVV